MRPNTSQLKTTCRIWYMNNKPQSGAQKDLSQGPRPNSKESDTMLQTRVWS